MKKNKLFTIMIVPDSSRVVTWTIPSVMMKVMIGLACLLIVGVGAILFDYVQLSSQIAENKSLKIENRQLAIQIQSLDNKLLTVANRLDNIGKFEEKIRKFTSLQGPDRSKTLAMGPLDKSEVDPGVGGPAENLSMDESVNTSRGIAGASDPLRMIRTASQVSSVDLRLREVARVSQLQEQSIHDLYEIVQENQSYLRSMPSIKPASGWITSTFGYRPSPYTGGKKFHDGVDIATSVGTPVYAPADGVITFAGVKPGYGLVLVIDHGYGLETRFAHNSKFIVKTGDIVKRGDHVVNSGNTGLSTGPHVHYEVRYNGIPIDPTKYFLDD